MKVLHSILLVRRYKEIDVFMNNVAKMSHIYVLEIYFVDYYDGALHYYIITALSSLCHYVSMSLCQSHLGSPFHCQVLSRESR